MLWSNNYNKMTTRHKRVARLAFAPACGLRPFLYVCACALGACGLHCFIYVCLRPACGLGPLYIFMPAARARELRPGGPGYFHGPCLSAFNMTSTALICSCMSIRSHLSFGCKYSLNPIACSWRMLRGGEAGSSIT